MKNLQGSEKQIAWANEIRNNFLAYINKMINKQGMFDHATYTEAQEKGLRMMVAAIEEKTEAAWLIEKRQGLSQIGRDYKFALKAAEILAQGKKLF